jgi:hypothetical protein
MNTKELNGRWEAVGFDPVMLFNRSYLTGGIHELVFEIQLLNKTVNLTF